MIIHCQAIVEKRPVIIHLGAVVQHMPQTDKSVVPRVEPTEKGIALFQKSLEGSTDLIRDFQSGPPVMVGDSESGRITGSTGLCLWLFFVRLFWAHPPRK